MRGGLGALLVVVGWLLLPLTARAAGPADDRCGAVWALSGLTPEEQSQLFGLCSRRERPGLEVMTLLAALTTRTTWEAGTVATIAAAAAPHLDLGKRPEHAAQAQRLQSLRAALRRALVVQKAGGRCGWLRQALDDYVADLAAREVPVPPIAGYALAGDRCLELPQAAVDEVDFLTISADSAASLAVVAGAAERLVVQWFDASDAIEHAGRRIFVVAVPRFSVVTVEARQRDADLVARWHGFVTRDLTVWDLPPEAGCLRASIDLDPDTVLLLDGQPLTRGTSLARKTVGVLGGDHELVALRCAAGRCSVQFREVLAASARTQTRNLCQEVALDLHRRNSVAVLGGEAAPGCDKGLAFQVGVQAADYLRATEPRTGRVFRDLKAVASLTDALATLKSSLNPAAGQAVGASAGSDSLEQLGSVAKEAWRQGIDSLLTFELRCAASGEAKGWTIVGSKLAVREVLERQRGEVAGLDLQRMIMIESLRIDEASELTTAVASVIDRLFERPYVRILGDGATSPYRKRVALEVTTFGDVYAGGDVAGEAASGAATVATSAEQRPTIVGLPLTSDEAAQVCPRLRGPDRGGQVIAGLLGRGASRSQAQVEVRRVDGGEDEADPRSASFAASIRAARPGIYAVVARAPRSDDIADAVCVQFETKPTEVWGSFAFASELTTTAGVRDYQWFHLRLSVGRTWFKPLPWLGFGVSGVYSFNKFLSRDGLPSWQSVDVAPDASRDPLEWNRHAFMVGPLVEVRSRWVRFPIEWRARLSVVGGLGVVDVSQLQAYESFATRDPFRSPNRRLTPNFDATLDLGVCYPAGPITVGHSLMFATVAINEMLSRSHATTALNGGGLVLGLALTIGGGL